MDVVLNLAHQIDDAHPAGTVPSTDSLIDKLIFPYCDVVYMTARNTDKDGVSKGITSS